MYYIYMVRCRDNSLYTGITTDVARRMREHTEQTPGCAKYTRSRQVVTLEALWSTDGRSAALRLEAAIKRHTKAQKEQLLLDPTCLAAWDFPGPQAACYTHHPGVTLEACLSAGTARGGQNFPLDQSPKPSL